MIDQTYLPHEWALTKEGNPKHFDLGDIHAGPYCVRCKIYFCISCEPYVWGQSCTNQTPALFDPPEILPKVPSYPTKFRIYKDIGAVRPWVLEQDGHPIVYGFNYAGLFSVYRRKLRKWLSMNVAKLAAEIDAWIPSLETVELTKDEFESLLEYSTTIPTGKPIGKQWRRQLYFGKYKGQWVRAEYTEDPEGDPEYVGIKWMLIRLKEAQDAADRKA